MFHTSALHLAVGSGNTEIIQLLLECDKTDVNLLSIFSLSYFIKFQKK